MIDERTLNHIERAHDSGVTSAEILDILAQHGVRLTEANLRKYVQIGLLPRSVRVGRKGRHQGSQGVYPIHVIRQILRIKQMMTESYTIEQIQREFLFARNEIEQLEQALARVFEKFDTVLRDRRREVIARPAQRELSDVRVLGKELLSRLVAIESKLTSRVRFENVVAS